MSSCDDLTGPFDTAGPDSAVSVTVAFKLADDLSQGRASTLIRVHAAGPYVADIARCLFGAGLEPLSIPRVRGCDPDRGCVYLYLLVHGHHDQTDLCTALLPIAMPGTLPIPFLLPSDD